MSGPFTVFVVDDDALIQDVMGSILEPDSTVTCFDSAEACRDQLATTQPDMFLLDVSLPGMSGYDFCRAIKDDPALARIPVTFISSHDTIEDRLKGYDSGGEDFIVKPFAPDEVLRKVKVAKTITQNKRALQEQAEAAEYLSSLALASMDEAGLVLQFMSKLIGWDNEMEIGAGLLELMQRYRLDAVVQLRVSQRTLTLGASGPNIPLEVSVLDHVKGLGRIFEFRTRGVHNFDRVTLMVNNLPVHDPDFCGRLRDNLSVAAQGADARLRAIEIEEENRRNQVGILNALRDIGATIDSLGEAHQRDHTRSSAIIAQLQDNLIKSFLSLGLSGDQERLIENLVNEHMGRLIDLLDRSKEIQSALQAASQRLEALRQS